MSASMSDCRRTIRAPDSLCGRGAAARGARRRRAAPRRVPAVPRLGEPGAGRPRASCASARTSCAPHRCRRACGPAARRSRATTPRAGGSRPPWRSRLVPAGLAIALILFTALRHRDPGHAALEHAAGRPAHRRPHEVLPGVPPAGGDRRRARSRGTPGGAIRLGYSRAAVVAARTASGSWARAAASTATAACRICCTTRAGTRCRCSCSKAWRGEPADVTTFGHRSRIWSRGPTTFVLVSPPRPAISRRRSRTSGRKPTSHRMSRRHD